MKQVPVNVIMSLAKKELKQFVMMEKQRRGIPSYLMASIMADVLCELRSDEIDELIDATVSEAKEGEPENDNTSKQP